MNKHNLLGLALLTVFITTPLWSMSEEEQELQLAMRASQETYEREQARRTPRTTGAAAQQATQEPTNPNMPASSQMIENQARETGRDPWRFGQVWDQLRMLSGAAQDDRNTATSSQPIVQPSSSGSDAAASVAAGSEVGSCEICTNDHANLYALSCKHKYCVDCLRTILNNAIAAKNTADLRCPNVKCRQSMADDAVKFAQGREIIQRLNDVQTEEWLRQQRDVKHCPTPGCNHAYITDSQRVSVRCPGCAQEYCSHCLVNHAVGAPCNQQQAATSSDQASKEWLNHHTKQCPNCHANIEKNGGCNHMTCEQCRHEFCWLCLKDFQPRKFDMGHFNNGRCQQFTHQDYRPLQVVQMPPVGRQPNLHPRVDIPRAIAPDGQPDAEQAVAVPNPVAQPQAAAPVYERVGLFTYREQPAIEPAGIEAVARNLPPREALARAIALNDGEAVGRILDNHAWLINEDLSNSRHDLHDTPLHHAARGGNARIVAILLDRGANPQIRDHLGFAPAHYAHHHGQDFVNAFARHNRDQAVIDVLTSDELQQLVNQPLPPYRPEQTPREALDRAIAHNDVDAVGRILGRNPELLNERDVDTQIQRAAIIGNRRVVDFLLNRRAHAETVARDTAAVRDDAHHNPGIPVRTNFDINEADELGWTPLMRAAFNGQLASVQRLLTISGIDVNIRGHNDNTALMYAVMNDHQAIVELLLTQPNIDVNAHTNIGDTALTYANRRNNHVIERLLIEAQDRGMPSFERQMGR